MGSVLCVMGGQLRFLGHSCSSDTCTGSTLDVMDYGLAKVKEFSNELTTRTLFIYYNDFITVILANFINMHLSLYNIYTYP